MEQIPCTCIHLLCIRTQNHVIYMGTNKVYFPNKNMEIYNENYSI